MTKSSNNVIDLVKHLKGQGKAIKGAWSIDQKKAKFFDLENVELSEEGMKHYANFVAQAHEEQVDKWMRKVLKKLSKRMVKGKWETKFRFFRTNKIEAVMKRMQQLNIASPIKTKVWPHFCNCPKNYLGYMYQGKKGYGGEPVSHHILYVRIFPERLR